MLFTFSFIASIILSLFKIFSIRCLIQYIGFGMLDVGL